METSAMTLLSQLGMEDTSFMNQWHMSSMDELNIMPLAAEFGQNLHHFYSRSQLNPKNSLDNPPHDGVARHSKQLKTDGWSSCGTDHIQNLQASASPTVASLLASNYTNQIGVLKPKEEAVCSVNDLPSDFLIPQSLFDNRGTKRFSAGSRISPQDHIIAERKRREKLSQRFIALSAIVPGLKKMDKVSVLGDAIKYLKHLQEKVKTLEEESRKKNMESVIFVKKSQLFADDENSSSNEIFSNYVPFNDNEPFQEIEAKLCDRNVLIRIHCEKRKGVVEKIIAEIEKFHLSIVNSSVMTFGALALDITIIAQMDEESCLTAKDIVKNLRSAFHLFK